MQFWKLAAQYLKRMTVMTGAESHYCHQSPRLENNRRMRTNQRLLYFCGEIRNGYIQKIITQIQEKLRKLMRPKITENQHKCSNKYLSIFKILHHVFSAKLKIILKFSACLKIPAPYFHYLTEDIDCDVEVLDAPTDADWSYMDSSSSTSFPIREELRDVADLCMRLMVNLDLSWGKENWFQEEKKRRRNKSITLSIKYNLYMKDLEYNS